MNNEPVAFVTGLNKFDPVMVDTVLKVGTPLYTHPTKTLTDDAKYNVTVKWDGKTTHHANVSLDTPLHYNEPKTLTDEEIWDWFKENTALEKESALKIARAILRKAQEK